jgi:SSS family solute:Na+ symporter
MATLTFLASSSFVALDWVILAGYLVLLGVTGWWLSRKKQTGTDDFFLGSRQMPVWAVAFSVLATSQSAATFIGGPGKSYSGDLSFMLFTIGQIVAAVIVAFLFIPVFYRHKVATVYELLELRVGRPARQAASWMFMVGRVFASGARLFIASLAVSLIMFGDIIWWHVSAAIVVMTLLGIFYTLFGGIRSVIWTDVIQTFVYIGAALAALIVLWNIIPADSSQILTALSEGRSDGGSKLNWFNTSFGGFGPEHTFTIWTALIGFTLLNIGFLGADQDGMQRMLTCKSARHGAQSALGAILLGIPVTLLFLAVGLLLWVLYTQPQLMAGALPGAAVSGEAVQAKDVFLRFIMTQMPAGLGGLMMAGVIAVGLSSINSALNAMASTFVNDVYRHWRKDRDEKHYLRVGRLGVFVWGVILGVFAIFCFFWQQASEIPLIVFALNVMAFAYAGLVAVFLTVLLTKRGSNASVIASLIVGFLLVLLMQPAIWTHIAPSSLGDTTLALPWQLTIATGVSAIVCCLGKSQKAEVPGEQAISNLDSSNEKQSESQLVGA